MSFGRRKFIPKSTLEKILGLVFVVMLVVVSFLTYEALKKRSLREVPDYDQEVPFMTKETNSTIKIDVSNMQYDESKIFVFRVTNYNDKYNTIIKKELTYDIYFEINDLDLNLELYKDDKNVDLLEDNEDLLIRNKVLKANKKQNDYYKLIVTAKENIGKDKAIVLNFFSEEE